MAHLDIFIKRSFVKIKISKKESILGNYIPREMRIREPHRAEETRVPALHSAAELAIGHVDATRRMQMREVCHSRELAVSKHHVGLHPGILKQRGHVKLDTTQAAARTETDTIK